MATCRARRQRTAQPRQPLRAVLSLARQRGHERLLGGAGFAALSHDFGRPLVRSWIPWQAELAGDLRGAACATREIATLPAHADLAEWQRGEARAVRAAMADGALAAVTACNPADWTLVRFRLWPEARADLAGAACQAYRVGRLSQPQ